METINDVCDVADSHDAAVRVGLDDDFFEVGLTVGLVVPDVGDRAEKRAAYAADITYGTNNELGFDYLRDKMALSAEERSQRGHVFCIVDEVDSILIDEARTPLIISG